jgi:ATP-dependent DNA ligase
VRFDQLQGGRFRHAARFLRWRPDRDPASCTFEQLEAPRPFQLAEIEHLAP